MPFKLNPFTGKPDYYEAATAGGVTEITGTANQVLVNGTSGSAETGSVTLTAPQDIATTSSVTFGNVTMGAGGALRTGTSAGNTLLIQGYDTDTGPAYTTFATITAGTTPTCIFTASDGSGAAPTYSFVNATNMGMYKSSSSLAFATGGVVAVTINSSGLLSAFSGLTVTNTTTMNGAQVVARTATAIDFSVLTGTYLVAVTDTSAVRTITLPNGTTTGRMIIIKDESGAAGTNNIQIVVSGGVKTIDGAAGIAISTNYGVARIYYNGTNFFTF